LPVFAVFSTVFVLCQQKYFLPWQKTNPGQGYVNNQLLTGSGSDGEMSQCVVWIGSLVLPE